MSRALSIAAVFVGGLCICTTGFSVGGDEDFEEYTFGVRNLRGYRRLNLIGGKDLRPKWLRGEIEKPRGTKNMGTWTAWVYTKEQMERLGVGENGEKTDLGASGKFNTERQLRTNGWGMDLEDY